MKWIKKHYKTILIWLVLLAVAPLMLEILFIANMMGAEVAFGFLLLFIKQIYENWQAHLHQAKALLKAAYQIIQAHPICQTNIYIFHVCLSMAVLFFSGSMAYSVLVWYPVTLLNSV